jgi:hypothetical protein
MAKFPGNDHEKAQKVAKKDDLRSPFEWGRWIGLAGYRRRVRRARRSAPTSKVQGAWAPPLWPSPPELELLLEDELDDDELLLDELDELEELLEEDEELDEDELLDDDELDEELELLDEELPVYSSAPTS